MKRISAGYYEGEYKGVSFVVIKWPDINTWYWKCGKDGGDDVYTKKSIAILAVKEFIDELLK